MRHNDDFPNEIDEDKRGWQCNNCGWKGVGSDLHISNIVSCPNCQSRNIWGQTDEEYWEENPQNI